jgi:ADP-ribose pyrophosphatase YjhB (NUDIX family)
MPIACVDLIFEREDRSILYGWRVIRPYSGTWALVGGRLLHRENLIACARRIAREYGLGFRDLYLVGVFPITFPGRSDLVVSLAALGPTGDATVDNVEFSKFVWSRRVPSRLGMNYRRMLSKWVAARESRAFLQLNKVL